MIIYFLFLLFLIALNGFFAASEIALISLNDNKIKIMADSGNKKAKRLVKILSEPTKVLATIQIGITLAGFFASAFAAESFADPLVTFVQSFDVPITEGVLKVSIVLIITIILAYFTLVLGELVPKRIAMQKSEEIAFAVIGPLSVLSKIASPFVKLLSVSTNFFVRLFGIDPNASEENVTEEEIRMMVDVGEEKGAIYEHEKFMINNIFEFNNKTAEDIMTHRIKIVGISVTSDLTEILKVIEEEKYTRIPVYNKKIDDIVGILHVKDLLNLINNDKSTKEFVLEDYVRKPFFVPIHSKIDELFIDFQSTRTHFAVVIDEYGGTEGILTLEDILEEIVGNIFDEDDEMELDINKIAEDTYEVNGMINLDELEAPLNILLPVQEYDTLSGFLISLLGKIPPKGDVVEVNYKHLRMEIVEVTEKRIEKVIVRIDNKSEFESTKTI